tara:strand:+ start:115 stop:597 length:483 start_codon:yes stop_codon:yes gene_type:complete
MLNFDIKYFNKIILIVSFLALVSAYFIEYVLKYQPCNLCLLERIPYATAIIIILLEYKFKYFEKFLISSLIIIFLLATILSLYHLGIEMGFIKESIVCELKNSDKLLTKDDILRQLGEKRVSCKDVAFKIFGLSLTTYNVIISFLIAIILIIKKNEYGKK